jgi:hypothetical protein
MGAAGFCDSSVCLDVFLLLKWKVFVFVSGIAGD